ncbi:IgGFc-binding protein [Holothuria leucospilota]|uniref:IgGFc-binding protein n=1 Tax=Holothuria leucospilota TaxID=206669 RepID=A0A9Q1HAP0_HOLLE|nr:IgGFc-binding protein [Holothuria leucospilota]
MLLGRRLQRTDCNSQGTNQYSPQLRYNLHSLYPKITSIEMAVCRILLIVLVIINVCISLYEVQGQEDCSHQGTTRGRRFAIAFTVNYEGVVNITELSISVVAFSNNPTTVTVSSKFQIDGIPFQETFEIQPRGFHRVSVPSELILGPTYERSNKVIELTASSDVSVHGLNYAPFTTDAFLGIPVDHLGLNYVVMSYEESNQWPSLFAVVGVEDNTQVFATLTGTVTFNGDTYASGDVLDFIVNKNEVVQIVSDRDFFGGSIIKSDKPVAFFSGDLCARTPGSTCDILSEQIVPVRSWGTTHIYTATGSSRDSSIYAIYAYYEDTIVSVPGLNAITLQPGENFKR